MLGVEWESFVCILTVAPQSILSLPTAAHVRQFATKSRHAIIDVLAAYNLSGERVTLARPALERSSYHADEQALGAGVHVSDRYSEIIQSVPIALDRARASRW